MSIQILAPNALNQDTFPSSVQAVDDQNRVLTVDLRACTFVDSFSVIELLTCMARADRADWSIHLLLPAFRPMRGYLANMGLFRLMPPRVRPNELPPSPSGPSDQFLPITPIDLSKGEYGIEELCNFAYPHIPYQYVETFIESLAEVGSNVVQHSEARQAFVSGQRLDVAYRGRLPPRLHLVVGDTGIGIKASLARARPEVASLAEEDAILKAIEAGVTGKPGINSGVGLTTILGYVQGVGGEMRIRSGSATVVFNAEGRQVLRSPGLPGTIVSVELCRPRRGPYLVESND
jgi:hypothetical protein